MSLGGTLPPLRTTPIRASDEAYHLISSSAGPKVYLVYGERSQEFMTNLKRSHRSSRCTLDLDGLRTMYSEDFYERNIEGKKFAFADITSDSHIIEEVADQLRKFLRWELVIVVRVTERQLPLLGA